MVRQARREDTEPSHANGLLSAGLALWQGEPLADVAGEWLPTTIAPGLAEERLAALEHRAALDLSLGRHQEVVGELSVLVHEHPLREKLVFLLMTVLHRCGLRTDALAVFQRIRRRFADELGVEPGAALQRLYQAILSGEEDPESPKKRMVPPSATATEFPAAESADLVVPRHLPPGINRFTGRTDELAALNAMLRPATTSNNATSLCVIVGTGGVGKTALVVHWAHQVRDQFPDGQLYVNLLGFGSTDIARPPAEALRQFLDALGVHPQRIPTTLDAQVGLYRSLMADRRMLILLDNALDAEQVRPLLPNSPGCLVLVTSRVDMTGLVVAEGARALPLGLLTPEQSRELLARHLGADRLIAEWAAVNDIISRCAGLPLALSIVAARAYARPRLTLASYFKGFDDSSEALDAFDDGDTSVRTVFAWSYQALGPEAARLFRLLGLLQVPEISVPGAASLARVSIRQARRLLTELARAHLMIERSAQRYGLFDLLWAYAREQTQLHDSEAERREALHRLLDHYLHSASLGDRHLDQHHRIPLTLSPPPRGIILARITNRKEANAWFRRERVMLLVAVRQAARHGFDSHAWQLAGACRGFLCEQGHLEDQAAMHRIGLAAAMRLSDPAAQAHARFGLAQALMRLGQDGEAESQSRHALELFGKVGNHIGQGDSHIILSVLQDRQGRFSEALHHNEEARQLYRIVGGLAGEARTLNNIGWFHAQLGEYRQALTQCQKALNIHRELDNIRGEAATLDSLGHIHYQLGQYEQAISYYRDALNRQPDVEMVRSACRAGTLGRLGESLRAAGYLGEGCRTTQQANSLLSSLAPGDAASVRAHLTTARLANSQNTLAASADPLERIESK